MPAFGCAWWWEEGDWADGERGYKETVHCCPILFLNHMTGLVSCVFLKDNYSVICFYNGKGPF